jgi:hypothetical protein
MHVLVGGALCRMIVGTQGEIEGARRPGVIAWRPLSDDRRGAGGIQGARHAMHVRLGGALCRMIGGGRCMP